MNMRVSQTGIELIKKFEGFSAELYFCPAGKRTIGYGHVIRQNERLPDIITPEEAETLLKQDVIVCEAAIRALVKVELRQPELDALASFIYNIGSKAFEKSTLLRFLNKNDRLGAAGQFYRWVYAGGRKMAGLQARRAAEAQLFQS